PPWLDGELAVDGGTAQGHGPGVVLQVRAHRLDFFGWVLAEHRIGYGVFDPHDDAVRIRVDHELGIRGAEAAACRRRHRLPVGHFGPGNGRGTNGTLRADRLHGSNTTYGW